MRQTDAQNDGRKTVWKHHEWVKRKGKRKEGKGSKVEQGERGDLSRAGGEGVPEGRGREKRDIRQSCQHEGTERKRRVPREAVRKMSGRRWRG